MEKSLRIGTLNTWKNEGDYAGRLAVMARGLGEICPDVLLLQEVFRTSDGTADTGVFLARELGLHLAFVSAREKLRRWNGEDVGSASGLAILSRWPMEKVERLTLPSDPRGGERVAMLADILTPFGRVLAGCIHLSHLRGDSAMRANQLAALLATPRWKTPAALRFFGGDCNATLGSPELISLSAHPDLEVRDVWRLADGAAERSTHPIPPREGRTSSCIDFIFSVAPRGRRVPEWRAAQVALALPRESVFASDHAAVLAEAHLSDEA